MQEGIYNEALHIDKQITIVSNGFVELRSSHDNVITCAAQGEGCLVKGFTIRRLDATKGDPLSAGAQVDSKDDDQKKDGGRNENSRQRRGGSNDRQATTCARRNAKNVDTFSCENKFAIYIKEGKATI